MFSGDESRLLLRQEDLRGEGPLLAGPAQVPAQPFHHAVDAQEPEAVAAPLGGGKAAAGLFQLPAGGEVGKGDVPVSYTHLDMVALETVQNQYLGGDTSLACSAETAAKIDQQVVELVKAQHAKAKQILTENSAKLHELAKYLYEKETITGQEFMEILEEGGGAA